MKKEDIDISAPIIPGESIGGVPLYAHIRDYRDLVSSFKYYDETGKDISRSFFGTFDIGYEYRDVLTLVFSIINGKLLKIIAWKGYQGLLFGKIKVGMNIEEAMKLDLRIHYDEDHEYYYVKGENGIVLETEVLTKNIFAITVYVKEIDEYHIVDENHKDMGVDFEKMKEFDKGNW